MKNYSQGFTLIELLIVISIITILATMALPSFMDRTIRAQVTEGLTLSEIAKEVVRDYYKAKRRLPRNNAQAGLPRADKIIGNFVTSVKVVNGAINITFGNRVNKHVAGKVLTLLPAVVKGEPSVPVAWVCGYASVPNGMTVTSANTSDILPRRLPVDCRY